MAGGETRAVLADPAFGLALQHAQDLLDRMQVGGSALAGIAPLLEQAELDPAALIANPCNSPLSISTNMEPRSASARYDPWTGTAAPDC
jgi:hypothetical protein